MSKRIIESPAHAEKFLQKSDFYSLCQQAYKVQHEMHGNCITYINNLHINPTNLCVYQCKFCDFSRRPEQPGAYSLGEDEVLERISRHKPQEVHIVGGLWKTWGLTRYVHLIELIRNSFPDISIKACTAVEVAYFSHMEKIPVTGILEKLKNAGVAMLPGGGAEVLSDRIHQTLCKDKISPSEWLAIHQQAHEMELPTNATLLFGHIETRNEILQHLDAIRSLQDKTNGFVSFVPLLYQTGYTKLVNQQLAPHKVIEVIALCRLYLDNISTIKAYWPTLGLGTTAMALSAGANDVDGTLGEETIMQMADNDAPKQLSEAMLQQLISDAGLIPIRRDGKHTLLQAV